MSRTHALVIGGSGMLAGVVCFMTSRFDAVTVLARDPQKMAPLLEKSPRIHPLYVDYRKASGLRDAIHEAVFDRGEISSIVAWVHQDGRDALSTIIEQTNAQAILHVLGSRANPVAERSRIRLRGGQSYSQVQLGSIVKHGARRWLTDEEIVQGVTEAFVQKSTYRVVGEMS